MAIKLQILVDDKGNVKVENLGKVTKKTGKVVDKESKKMQSAWSKSADSIQRNVLGLVSMAAAAMALRSASKVILGYNAPTTYLVPFN